MPAQTATITSNRLLWSYLFFATFSLFLTLFLPYRYEEANYTQSAFEMWQQHQWLITTQYGYPYPRFPLFSWLILIPSSWIGWENTLPIARSITALATLCTTALVGLFVHKQRQNMQLALLSMACFLCGDVLFMRGWLAYADPLFTTFIFASQYFLFEACRKQKSAFLNFAHLCCLLAFASKSISGFLFYFTSIAVLSWQHPNRSWLKKQVLSAVLLLLLFGLCLYYNHILSLMTPLNYDNFLGRLITLYQLPFDEWITRVANHIAVYFGKNLLLFTATLVILIKNKGYLWRNNPWLNMLLWITILNHMPYLIIQGSTDHIRYLLPLMPLLSVIIASAFLTYRQGMIMSYGILFSSLLIKYVLIFFTGYQTMLAKDHAQLFFPFAKKIVRVAKQHPIYWTSGDTLPCCFAGTPTSIVTWIDVLRVPHPAIIFKPLKYLTKSNYYLSNIVSHNDDKIIYTFNAGSNTLYFKQKS
jgi:hypothetical protein